MATIHEKLVLGDHFSSTLSKYQNMVTRAAGVSDGLTRKIIGIGSAWLSLRCIGQAAGLADTISTTTARLDMMNDGLQSIAELTEMIYTSANRARGAYQDTADMVAKLGTLAGEAFDGDTSQIVAFSEQINKLMTLSGATSAGRQAAMLQLTQAMSSGVLRGEELNSILEQTPTIAQTIARYLGVSTGEMRNLASEGLVTADVVKNAIFSAAEETNAKFAQMPLTFSQAATRIKNAAIMEFQPIGQRLSDALNSDTGQAAIEGVIRIIGRLGDAADWTFDKIGEGAAWVRQNWEALIPIAAGLGAAALVAGGSMVAAGAAGAVAWAAANWPLLLVAAGVAGVIALARECGATWEDIGGVIGGVFGGIYSAGRNTAVNLQNVIAELANFMGNAFDDPALAVEMLFYNLAMRLMKKLYTVAYAFETLTGMGHTASNIIGNVMADIAEGQKKAVAAGWTTYVKPWKYTDFYTDIMAGVEKGQNVGSYLDNFDPEAFMESLPTSFDLTGGDYSITVDGLSGIAADVSSINKSISMSDEVLRSLVDMAERRYINQINLTSQTPVINITGANTGHSEADRRALADALRDVLVEQASAGSSSSTAEAY